MGPALSRQLPAAQPLPTYHSTVAPKLTSRRGGELAGRAEPHVHEHSFSWAMTMFSAAPHLGFQWRHVVACGADCSPVLTYGFHAPHGGIISSVILETDMGIHPRSPKRVHDLFKGPSEIMGFGRCRIWGNASVPRVEKFKSKFGSSLHIRLLSRHSSVSSIGLVFAPCDSIMTNMVVYDGHSCARARMFKFFFQC